jgi:hypothetical protein
MSAFPVVLDACVLAPYPLANFMLWLADQQTYRPLWSAHILAETRRTMVSKLGIPETLADKRLDMMRENFIDAEVTGYADLIPAMKNHRKDRHVLAAAVRERAEVIVTFNLKDFPARALDPYKVRALHPDDFLLDQIDLYPEATRRSLFGLIEAGKEPSFTPEEILLALGKRGVPKFAEAAQPLFRY